MYFSLISVTGAKAILPSKPGLLYSTGDMISKIDALHNPQLPFAISPRS
jgi:hypothetical protein